MIFDANSIINLAKKGKASKFFGHKTTSLCLYEIANAIWKEIVLLKKVRKDYGITFCSELIRTVKDKMVIIEPEFHKVLEIAINFEITAYDASYVWLAMKFCEPLVTDDKELRKRVSRYVKVLSSEDL